jgi:hypothetical protein
MVRQGPNLGFERQRSYHRKRDARLDSQPSRRLRQAIPAGRFLRKPPIFHRTTLTGVTGSSEVRTIGATSSAPFPSKSRHAHELREGPVGGGCRPPDLASKNSHPQKLRINTGILRRKSAGQSRGDACADPTRQDSVTQNFPPFMSQVCGEDSTKYRDNFGENDFRPSFSGLLSQASLAKVPRKIGVSRTPISAVVVVTSHIAGRCISMGECKNGRLLVHDPASVGTILSILRRTRYHQRNQRCAEAKDNQAFANQPKSR